MQNINLETPNEYLCPISLEIMTDPVICEDGITYERNCINKITNGKSPITRQPININKLIPNIALRQIIQKYIQSINQTPTQQSIQTPTQQSIQTPIQQSIQTPSQQSAQTPIQQSAQIPTQQSAQIPTQRLNYLISLEYYKYNY